MQWLDYEILCVRRAFEGILGRARLFSGLAMLAWPVVLIWFAPPQNVVVWAPTSLFAAVFVVLLIFGLSTSSWRLHNEQEDKIKLLESQLDDRSRRQATADALAKLHYEGQEVLLIRVESDEAYEQWKAQVEDWFQRTQRTIEEFLGFSELELFRSFSTSVNAFTKPYNARHLMDQQFFGAKVLKLRMMIGDLNTRLR